MKDKQYIIFDLDGTLVDSHNTVTNACKRVLANHVPDRMPSQGFFESYRYKEIEKMFTELANMAGMNKNDFRHEYDQQYALDCLSGTTIIAKQQETLKTSRTKGLGIIILTNKHQQLAEEVCNSLFGKKDIDIIIGRKDTEPIKPRLVLIDLLSAHDIYPKQCVAYYGDSKIDQETAELLNVKFINVKNK